jgi:adenosylhomocysteine nucleosidase
MSGRTAVIAVTSLSLEGRIASGPGVSVICEHASRLVASLETAIEQGVVGIVSFGIAGGLAPQLAAGDWVVGTGVRTGHERHRVDARWARRLAELLPGALQGEIAGVDRPVAHAWEKRQLHAETAALAVDMESHVAGKIAAAHKIPFAVCRTIIDSAARDLPPAALVGLRDDGRPDVLAVARSVAQEPRQLAALGRTAIDAWIAREALRRGRRFLGAGFGCPYFTDTIPGRGMAAHAMTGMRPLPYLNS